MIVVSNANLKRNVYDVKTQQSLSDLILVMELVISVMKIVNMDVL